MTVRVNRRSSAYQQRRSPTYKSWWLLLVLCLYMAAFLVFYVHPALFQTNLITKVPIARSLNSKQETENQHDRLWPLRKMFATAGKETKVREKTLNSTSIEVPLTDLEEKNPKSEVLLLVIVLTAPSQQERRMALRQTWWSRCVAEVKCVFLTDGLQLKEKQKENLIKESNTFGDIFFAPTENGVMMLGHRFLYLIMWAKARFNFQYLLRLDDDYFVCLDKLANELPSRPQTNLIWGWYHCWSRLVWMDEAWALFSKDVIETFLAQDTHSILCHPFGDQTYHLWIQAAGLNLTEFHDRRLHHSPRAGNVKKFFSMKNVCDHYIGIHGAYPNVIPLLWINSSDGPKNITPVTLLRDNCPNFAKGFNVNKFRGKYRHTPKTCINGSYWGSIAWHSSERKKNKPLHGIAQYRANETLMSNL